MLHTIENEFLRVTASERGAELMSIQSADGCEYLWQRDPAYWGSSSPTIFPYVARLTEGKYELFGKEYHLATHGFARASDFQVTEQRADRIVFTLTDSEATRAQYPYRFRFDVEMRLDGHTLHVVFHVRNLDTKNMYFGVGGHPGFNVPLEANLRFEDYALTFAQPCAPVRVGFTERVLVSGENAPYPLSDGCCLPLRHDLFDDDAIVLTNTAREVCLSSDRGTRGLRMRFDDFPIFGIWHKPKSDAPYVCLEPWSSLPARDGVIERLDMQKDLIALAPQQSTSLGYSVEIF